MSWRISILDKSPIAENETAADALARTLLASPALYSAEMRHCLALRTLVRAWSQYREDRAIVTGASVIGAECAAQRDAVLSLLAAALPDHRSDVSGAIRRVRSTWSMR